MALPQETFLGASIRNFNGSIGWNNQPSTLTVGLVEDATNGDSFDPPAIGSAVRFEYDQWWFGGILQGYRREYGQQGNPVYSLQIQDPRDLLSGVQLILQDYTGSTFGLSNIYNIYGNLESTYGFGGSRSNEAGIPWQLIRSSFWTLQNLKPIYFRGDYYLLDPFLGLDLLPYYFRIGGDSITALDYIQNICSAIACDFFIEMIPYSNSETPATNLLKVRLVRRNIIPRSNAINDFVTSTDGAVAKNAGYELSNEVTSRFLIGGKENNLYFQLQNTFDTASLYDDTIIPYWGYNAYDKLAIGVGDFNGPTGHEYQVTIDGRPLYLQTGNMSLVNYTTDLAELHAARAGQSSWESFLWFYDGVRESIHFGKARALGLSTGRLSNELMTWLRRWREGSESEGPKMSAVRAAAKAKVDAQRNYVWNEETKKKVSKVYAHINKYATEFYGKKFMVRVPFVAGAYVPETNIIKFSLVPTEKGYVEEAYWANATYFGYMPYNPEKFTADDNRIYPYARFANMSDTSYENDDGTVKITDYRSQYSFDKLSIDSFILDQYPNQKLGKMRENLFVKCQVEEKLVFLNPTTLFSPRAVITLDGPVANNVKQSELYGTALMQEIVTWLKSGEEDVRPSDDAIDTWAHSFGSVFGNDHLWKSKEANFNIPDMVAVPLESQILRYGPWYVQNTAGRVEYERDDSLVPWDFGSFSAMNLAGRAKVEDALTSQQVYEKGSVEYPGVPALTLGKALLSSGPTVTDINVDVSEQGVTTTYRMSTWDYQFGRLGKYNVERFTRLSKVAQEQRKAFRQLFGYKAPLNYFNAETKNNSKLERESETESVTMLTGEMVVRGSGDSKVVYPSVAAMPVGRLTNTLNDDTYVEKAGISFDGLFVPYSTDKDSASTTLPKFKEPSEDAESPTVDNLNPFGGSGIAAVFPETSEGMPDDIADDNSKVKALALKAPIIVGGWGVDTDGNPVPSGDGPDGYLPNHRLRADQHKVGPLDIRWDENRGVWNAAGSSAGSRLGVLVETLTGGGSGLATMIDPVTKQATSTRFYAHDYLLGRDVTLSWNTKFIANLIGGKWYVVAVESPC